MAAKPIHVKWNEITSLPELDGNDHAEKGITERGTLTHYKDNNTLLIYAVDEAELYEDDNVANRKIVGLQTPHGQNIIFNEARLKAIEGMTENDLPKIIEIANDPQYN